MQRLQLLDLLAQLDKQIKELEAWLEAQASSNEPVKLLRTQKGVGVLTALCVVNTVGDVTRFSKVGKQVVAFVGLDPVEK